MSAHAVPAYTCTIPAQYTSHQIMLVAGTYGIYVPIFAGALWASWQQPTHSSKWMRVISIVMFLIVTCQLALSINAMHPLDCPNPDSPSHPDQELTALDITPSLLGMSTVVTGVLADGVLGWRCYVLYNSRRWMKCALILTFVVLSGFGISMNALTTRSVSREYRYGSYEGFGFGTTGSTTFDLLWPFAYLFVNTVLTTATAGRIMIYRKRSVFHASRSRLVSVGRAIVESALISWLAILVLLVFQALMVAKWPGSPLRSTIEVSLSPALAAALPTIYAISQSLILARFALARLVASPNLMDTLSEFTAEHCVLDTETYIA